MSARPDEPTSAETPKVFICYRREETAAHAGRLNDAMVARFGESNVFMDLDLAPGVDFVERITDVVAACQVLIVVMGPKWATVEDEEGQVRIADPEDFVRVEVETALRSPDVTPIPVLVSGARMPKRAILPEEIRAITRRNALELSEARWQYDVGLLNRTLDDLLADRPAAPPPPAAEPTVTHREAEPAATAEAPRQTAPPAAGPRTTSEEAEAPARPLPPEREPSRPSSWAWWRWALLALAGAAVIGLAVALLAGGGSGGGGTTSGGGTPVSADEVDGIQLVPFTGASAFTLHAPQWQPPATEDPIGKTHLTAFVSPKKDMTVQVEQQPQEPLQQVAGKAHQAREAEGADISNYQQTRIGGRHAYLLQFTHNAQPDQSYLPAMGETYDSTYFFNDSESSWRVHAAVKTTVAHGKDIAMGLAEEMAATFEPKG